MRVLLGTPYLLEATVPATIATPMLMMPEGAEWLVILVIVILVFGASKLPDLARSSGQALRIFKAETKALQKEDVAAPPLQHTDGTTPTSTPSSSRTNTGPIDSGTPGV